MKAFMFFSAVALFAFFSFEEPASVTRTATSNMVSASEIAIADTPPVSDFGFQAMADEIEGGQAKPEEPYIEEPQPDASDGGTEKSPIRATEPQPEPPAGDVRDKEETFVPEDVIEDPVLIIGDENVEERAQNIQTEENSLIDKLINRIE